MYGNVLFFNSIFMKTLRLKDKAYPFPVGTTMPPLFFFSLSEAVHIHTGPITLKVWTEVHVCCGEWSFPTPIGAFQVGCRHLVSQRTGANISSDFPTKSSLVAMKKERWNDPQ